jgi:hypothetical protein
MSRSRLWRAAGAAFIAINLAGGLYAAAVGEPMHAAVHVVLLVLGISIYSAVRSRSGDGTALPDEATDRLKNLEQSVDKLAIGVERIGEAQRYQVKILDEKAHASSSKKEN